MLFVFPSGLSTDTLVDATIVLFKCMECRASGKQDEAEPNAVADVIAGIGSSVNNVYYRMKEGGPEEVTHPRPGGEQ